MANTGAEAFLNLHDVVKAARARTSRDVWDYLVGAAESETTMKRNRLAIDSLGLRPRVLRDLSDIDTGHEFLGRRLRLPIAFAPIGGLQSFDPGGGATVARVAAESGFVSIHSSVSAPGLEQTAAASNAAKIYQLYVRGDDAWIDDHVARARDAGFAAFCLTVDTAVYSRCERDIANRFAKPWRQRLAGLEYQAALSWDNVKHYKDRHDMPLAIKGISTVEDALLAVEHGCEMVYFSNHGGRQLDQGRGALDVFPDIRDAVAGRAKLIVDGGFTRATDVVKAIALGADLVAMGRIPVCGLAAAGQEGVVRTFELLEDEMNSALGLLGAPRLADLDQSFVAPAPPVSAPHVFSALPLLNLEPHVY